MPVLPKRASVPIFHFKASSQTSCFVLELKSLNLCSSFRLLLCSSFHLFSESLDLTQHRKLNFLCPPFMSFQATGKGKDIHTKGQTEGERQKRDIQQKQIPRIDFIDCVWCLKYLTSAAVNTVAS